MNDTGGFGLPQMSEREMFEKLLSSDSNYNDEEPAAADQEDVSAVISCHGRVKI
jgi:hypothetical protein